MAVLPDGLQDFAEESVHIVLLGDSTLDNGRYLDLALGELSIEKQLIKRCQEHGWDMTVLAQDGSMLEDVRQRQLPLIPEAATHIVLSASGNDLLSLLNQMVVANFTMSSMYATIGQGLNQVSESYRELIRELTARGCHIACCTLYRPNFNHFFFKSLATFSLGIHNSRINQISAELDCSAIDFANMFDVAEDFANPLELSTRGGSKVVQNIAQFIADFPSSRLHRRGISNFVEEASFLPASMTSFASISGIPLNCCATRISKRKVYSSKVVSQSLVDLDIDLANSKLGHAPLQFSDEQEQWRNPTQHPAAPGLHT